MTKSVPNDNRSRPRAGESVAVPSVAEYLERWLAHARGRVRVRVVTYEGYEALLRRHGLPRLGNLQLDELSPLQVQDLYRELLTGGEAGGAPPPRAGGGIPPRAGP